ncbi:UDP-N-acetylglucosamine 2-epimerase (non-hydrolyzing) [Pseudomonas sp. HMWF032]|uniref:non-hydrolyzing UDP-N-acetylglucosamine 2-epimerase n=1 Tax=Pseudomonas sp. HMWF032 TaxID=2056866 RepID=UPI000D3B53D7|nr:UDP-N-acetylglucosamine 2-epimerase (non-hydrolyzing) [Pseudomonas sp. HMWF032]PTS82351.1 UDP-N-acetylglucosamine 2-epimerase (non-hydrolyzing) [Pseudomonas sp. HMWF032]PTT72720.1 UDP-N-acetylglucosamine 2-epimerase (non-hydrolyzing) [Pseudomonas sp. HMWF010]
MHLVFVLGTRPEIIKLSSLISACIREGIHYTLIHTNQHYAASMDSVFFDELELPRAHFNLGVGSETATAQLARMMMGIEPLLQTLQPDYVVVQGDTNSSLAGGLAANKLNIPVAHVEAGLRSYDKTMPEEVNRILLDHLSSFWFCPSALQQRLLAKEGIQGPHVHVTGNTGNDATLRHARRAEQHSTIHSTLDLQPGRYLLLTCHRPGNTDDLGHFARLMTAVQRLADSLERTVVFPVHPRLGHQHQQIIGGQARIKAIDPVTYLDLLALLQGAQLVLTDSGGLQEEACVLQRPCLVLRANTERPESLESGAARLAPVTTEYSLVEAEQSLRRVAINWSNPFGDGQASQRILQVLAAHAVQMREVALPEPVSR